MSSLNSFRASILSLNLKTACSDTLYRLFFRFFAQNTGWTLPALFSMLRDLRDLASDVGPPFDI